jgi:hypothetical protein
VIIAATPAATPWTAVVRRVPASVILDYVLKQWQSFAADCTANAISLQSWKEPELTQALQARLSGAALGGHQPFDGDFLAETQRFELDPVTFKPICVARTDIEWLLSGFPRFTIEFKMLDGTPQLRTRYWRDGLRKFIAAIYAPQSHEGAMWAFLRTSGNGDAIKVRTLVAKRASQLACVTPAAPYVAPSTIASTTAQFDTYHRRSAGPSPLSLSHVFTQLP